MHHVVPLTGLNVSVYTGLNAQSYKWMGWHERQKQVGWEPAAVCGTTRPIID